MPPPTLDQIIELEVKVWEALRKGDPALDAAMLSDDFLGVYPSGFSDKVQHCGQLKNGPTVARYELKTPRLTHLGENRVMLSYLADWTRASSKAPQSPEQMYISSIWECFGGKWLNTFSQDTPVTKVG
jgi:hypothetical protein